jgi:aminoglycoside phosphotransferase (APT) family kinase protein
LAGGGWHANHAITIVERGGRVHRLILRRWACPGWEVDDPDFTAQREAVILELLAGSPVPAPSLVAAAPHAEACDVPALLITRLPGSAAAAPAATTGFLAQLAEALPLVHAVEPGDQPIPNFRTYVDLRRAAPPAWSARPQLWARALELVHEAPPPSPRRFIHREYHPGNTVWSRRTLVGIVDWTSGSRGPAAVDIGHMRWNLALTHGVNVADEFLALYRAASPADGGDQRYWDLVTLLDLVCDINAGDTPAPHEVARLEQYASRLLAR